MGKSITEEMYLSKKERSGMTIMLVLLGLFILGPYFWKQMVVVHVKSDPIIHQIPQVESEFVEKPKKEFKKYDKVKTSNHAVPQSFDPNQLDLETARNIGMPDRVYNNLNKYLQKGGKIKSKEQFGKIYGMDEKLFNKLAPYITIHDSISNLKKYISKDTQHVKMTDIKIEINSANEEQWDQLPGIGQKLASRIVKFRESLGGFYKIEQVCEVYGIADSVCQKITAFLFLNSKIKLLKINQSDKDELDAHPYIESKQADFIVKYRRNHERIHDLEEISKTGYFDQEWLLKMKNYFSFE
ncbi:MAG: helix-hairpin-helix domain-containing protein [Saprospiraceae bacterium]|nr:helix-hairpin-helix domain-containing protein [Saprospiraceae bacterium]